MTSKLPQPRVSYSYDYQGEGPTSPDSDSLVIKFSCPTVSCVWCVQLYCHVLAILGTILSTIWVFFHLYVLSHTTQEVLRYQRWAWYVLKYYKLGCNSELWNLPLVAVVNQLSWLAIIFLVISQPLQVEFWWCEKQSWSLVYLSDKI